VVALSLQKPETWRLSCQTIVGDKSNSGEVCYIYILAANCWLFLCKPRNIPNPGCGDSLFLCLILVLTELNANKECLLCGTNGMGQSNE
jgi:hypothetical protein